MDRKTIGIITIVAIVSIAGTFAVVSYTGTNSPQSSEPTPTQESVNEDEVPDAVQDSLPGAKALKSNLSESDTFENASVSVDKTGEIIVYYNSEAENGPNLKSEMAGVAFRYSTIADNSTGGLTVAANGVKLMVSSDAAIAYGNGKLKENAFEQTFHWSSVSQSDTEE